MQQRAQSVYALNNCRSTAFLIKPCLNFIQTKWQQVDSFKSKCKQLSEKLRSYITQDSV